MDDDDLSLDALGLVDPERPLPRPERPRMLDLSDEAVEWRKANPPAPLPPPAPPQARTTPLPTFQLLSVADLKARPRQSWLIHGILPAEGYGAIYGPSGSGKSFLEIDLLAALSDGQQWFGYKVRKACRVVCVVLEGQGGIVNRLTAWEIANDRDFPVSARFVYEPFRLLDRDHLLALAGAIDEAGGVDLIVFDTLNRAAPGVDENGPQDAGRILEALRELQALVGGLLLVVHHTGKNLSAGMRGHSSLFAGMDVVIACSRSGDAREWSVEKNKDGPEGDPHPYRLKVVEVGEDDDGAVITSCVVVPPGPHDASVSEAQRVLPRGGNQRIVYDALMPLFRQSAAFGRGGAPAVRPCITLDDAIAGCRDKLTVEPKRRTERARQAITGLIATRAVNHNDGWLWLP